MFILFSLLLSLVQPSFASTACEGKYDNLNIIHLETKSERDFFYCFGYHHGKDRAWQMDFFKRVAEGRNAEVYGFAHLKSDLMMRLLDLPSEAKRIWSEVPQEKKDIFQWYAEGVNEGFKLGQEAREFKDLGYRPDEWKAMDSMTLLLLQSFDQTRKTFMLDYEEEKARENWGARAEKLFDEDNLPWNNTILKEGEYPKSSEIQKTSSFPQNMKKIWADFPTVFGEESGSNNWVISGKKSKSGFAILANDPHLDLKTPLFWYWVHFKNTQREVIGASLPGVPVVPSGTNGKVAWGLTNAYINSADLVFLKDEKEGDITSFRPTVKVKWGFFKIPFFLKAFERTKTGLPVIPLELENEQKMILRWSGFGLRAHEILPMLDLMSAQNASEVNSVLEKINLPAWNYVFADTKGNIGFRVVGRAFKSTKKLPFGIPQMKMEDLSHAEYFSPAERPHVFNPSRNYIYTANNRHWPQDAAFYGGRGYNYSFRGFRIDELLQGQHDSESFKKIQCDRQAVDARFFVPKLLVHLKNSELAAWNFSSQDDSIPAALYRRLMDILMDKWKVNEYALYRLLDELSSEQSKELQVFYKLAQKDIDNRPWSKVHRLGFSHLSKNKDWVFSPEIAGPGDNHSVDPGTSKWNEDLGIYEQSSGASMRMVIELREKPVIHLALPGLNRDYSNREKKLPWAAWKSCTYETVSY